jgi:RNA polymerase sigma-70 factor (ECF subfamily)
MNNHSETNPLEELSDQELALRSERDPEFFGVFMERYETPLLRYIRRISSLPKEDAEDILQETFIKVYRNINDYDPEAKFSSWIYRIAHNQTIDTIRKRKIAAASFSIDANDAAQFLHAATDIGTETERSDILSRIEAIIRELPKTYREALILRFLEEKSYEEIMDILELPKGSVATLVHRGKKLLHEKMRETGITNI